MKILLTVISLCLGISFAYNLVCPDVSQWSIRARLLCPDPSKYYCLLDGNADVFIENCSNVDYTAPGKRLVIHYNFDAELCSKDVYQPFIHWTNESSGCTYKKSSCNEEGQVIYDDTITYKDVQCTCDYTRGYDFITRPKNPCYCIPSEEDCSCYFNPCQMSGLQHDNRCINTTFNYKKNCLPFKNDSKEEETTSIDEHKQQTTETSSEQDDLNFQVARLTQIPKWLVIAGIVLSVVAVIAGFFIYKENDELKAKNLEGTEIRYYIRVMIVGEHGVGKSCLLQRLLDKGIKEVKSTDGIDIVVRKCKIRLPDGKWIFNKDKDSKKDYAARIRKAIKQINNVYEIKSTVMTTNDQNSKRHEEIKEHREKINEDLEKEEIKRHQEEILIPEVRLDTPHGQQSQYSASAEKSEETLFELQSDVTATEQPTSSQPTNSLVQTRKVTKFLIEKKEKELDNLMSLIEPTNSSEQTRKVTKNLTEKIEKELVKLSSHFEKYDKKNDANEYIEISFWDFAGEKEHYGTHHTFLDSHALYLLVTDCSKEIKETKPCVTYDEIGEYIDFWFNTIHNCRDVEDDNTGEDLNPPIIAVCTGLDKLQDELEPPKTVEEQKDSYRINYKMVIKDEQKKKHLRETCFVSNTNKSLSDFKHVRQLIFEHGQKLKSYGKEMQLKWIRLEQSLDVLRDELPVITRVDVIDLAKKYDINEEEVEDFLKDQHKFGSIIYHSDIPDFVILSQKWLADVFKCLVSSKIDENIKDSPEWEKLLKTGILEKSLITELFKKKPEIEFEDHILKVLMKFNIIGEYMDHGKAVYYMPYMIKQEWSRSWQNIILHFVPILNEQNTEFTKTPWLCLEFDFFPLAFFSSVMIYYIGKYKICDDKNLHKLAIYHGVGVFFLDHKERNKFIVAFSKNTIAIQIWRWDQVAKDKCKEILSELRNEIKSNMNKYGGRGLTCTVKGMCPEAIIDDESCRKSYKDLLKDNTYICDSEFCKKKHNTCELLETWFYKYSDENLAKEKTVPPVAPSSAVSTAGPSVPPEAPSSAVSIAGPSVPPKAPSSAVSTAGPSVPPEAQSSAVSIAGPSVPPEAQSSAVSIAGPSVPPEAPSSAVSTAGPSVPPEAPSSAVSIAGPSVPPEAQSSAVSTAGPSVPPEAPSSAVSIAGPSVPPEAPSSAVCIAGPSVLPEEPSSAVSTAGPSVPPEEPSSAVSTAGPSVPPEAQSSAVSIAGPSVPPEAPSSAVCIAGPSVPPEEPSSTVSIAGAPVPPDAPSSAVSTAGSSVPPDAPSSAVSTTSPSVTPEAPSSAVSTAGPSVPPEAPSSAVSIAGPSVPPEAPSGQLVLQHIDESSQIGQDIVKQQIEELAQETTEIKANMAQETTEIETKMAQETTEIKELIDEMRKIPQYTVKQQIEEKRKKLLEKTDKSIKIHTDEKTFVHTNAINKALALVKENGIVILIGYPGIGKSCIGLELLRQISLDNERRRSIQLDDISQWQDMSDDMDAVFIDDVFGRTNCSYNDDVHSKLLEMIFTTIQNKKVKVILTLRNNIYCKIATITERFGIFHDKHVLDLSLDKHQMTVEEKKSCLMNYLTKNKILETDDIKKENINDDSILDSASTVYLHKDTLQKILHSDIGTRTGFPETCYLFASHRKFTKQGHNFFCHPTDNLLNEIKNLGKEGDTDKRKMIDFTLLVYILLNGDSVNIYEINLGSFRTMMETLYLNPLANIPTSYINDSAKRLSGKYLKINTEGNYSFQHKLISEAVMISYSFTDPSRVIPLLGFDFITEMARHQRYRPGDGEVIFRVPVSCYSLLAQRLLQLLDTDYKRKPYLFVQNLCKSKIITMTGNTVLQEMITQYKYKSSQGDREFIGDHQFSGRFPNYEVNTSYFYLPSTLMMFCNIDNNSVYQCLYDRIHNTLTSKSDSDVMEACKDTLMTALNFAIHILDTKRSTVILKILTDHNIKQDAIP